MSSLDCDVCCSEANVGSSTRESKEWILLRRYKCCCLGKGDEREDRSTSFWNPWSKGFWFDSDTRIANKDRTRTSVLVSSCLSRSNNTKERTTRCPCSGKFEFGFLLVDCADAKTTVDCKQRMYLRRYKCNVLCKGNVTEERTRTNLCCRSGRLCSITFKGEEVVILSGYECDCFRSSSEGEYRTRTSVVTLTKCLRCSTNKVELQTLRFKAIIWIESAVILVVILIVLIYITIIDLVWYSSKLRYNFISKRTDRIVEISKQCWRFFDVVDRLTDESIIITFTCAEGRLLIIVEGDSLCTTIEVTKRSRSNFSEDCLVNNLTMYGEETIINSGDSNRY